MSISGGAGKAAGFIAKPLLNAVQRELAKRGAGDLLKDNPASIETELDAALDVLLNDSETAVAQLKTWFKRLLSAPPEILKDQEAWDWLARGDVQLVLKSATRDFIAKRPLDAHLEAAEALYVQTSGGSEWYAKPLFIHAVSYLALSIKAGIDLGTKVILETQNIHAAEAKADNAAVREDLNRVVDILTAKEVQLPADEADRIINAELQLRDRTRSIFRPDKLAGLLALGERAINGNLKAASTPVRTELFRFVAAEHARASDLETARTWLAHAEETGATDLGPDRARLAIIEGRGDEAIALLDGRSDRLSAALRLDALAKAKGVAEAVAYHEEFGSDDELPGHTLPRLAQNYFELGRSEDAVRVLDQATPAQLAENPLLHFQRARARLALTDRSNAAAIFANTVMLPPPNVLRNDNVGRNLHLKAIEDFETLELLLPELGEADFLGVVEPQKLYLKLLVEDPSGRDRLEEKLKDPDEALVYGPLARLFHVPFDPEPLRARLAQSARLRPWTDPELYTAFQLQVRDGDPKALLAFLDEHRARLAEVEPQMSLGVEIEALVHLGEYDRARQLLDDVGDRLPVADRTLLTDLIAGKGEPELKRNLKRFEKGGDERDLNLLVQSMVDAKDPRTGDYAARLWRLRRRVETAELAANSFAFFGQDRELSAFLDEVGSLVDESFALGSHRAWLSYRKGDIVGARQMLASLRALKADDPNLRQLEINIALETGEWQRLDELIAADLERAENRTTRQLLQAAGLAEVANHPQTIALLRAAVAKAPNEPQVLMSAWDIAVRQGADISDEASGWLAQAIKESGDDGPFTKVGIKDIIDLRNDGMERAKKLDSLIMKGEVTIGMAAKPLGTTLAELILARVWENNELADPRARLFLPFYAGNRERTDLAGVDRIALDLPSILLLHMAGMLEPLFEGFAQVILPAGTLPALFEQMRRAGRGQPSRAVRAALIQRLIDDRQVLVLPDEEGLSDEVDRLWAGAEEHDGIIIHAPPLYEPGTFLEKIRDPAPFASRLASPRSLGAELLAKDPEIGRTEEELARLSTFAERWPAEPQDILSRPLMVDGTALLGLADLDFLEPLLDLGAKLYVTTDVTRLCEQERQEYEARNRLLGRIEEIRAILSKALLQARAKIGPALLRGPDAKGPSEDMSTDPLLSLLADAGEAQVIVADERVVNRHSQSTDARKAAHPVATSLDVIDALVERKVIAKYARSSARTRLRLSGAGLMPFSPDEFVAAARRSNWKEGPSAELKAIRDSIQLPILRKAVQLPDDGNWVTAILFSLARSIRDVFAKLDTLEEAEAAATFALNCLPDIVAYAAEHGAAGAKASAMTLMAGFYALVAGAPDVPTNRIIPFHRWFEARLLPLLEGRDAEALPLVEAQLKGLMLENYDFGDEEKALKLTRGDVIRFLFLRIPSVLANRLIEDPAVRAAVGDDVIAPVVVGNRRVRRKPLLDFLRSAYTKSPSELRDLDGAVAASAPDILDDGTVRAVVDEERIRFESSGLLAEDADIRRKAARGLLASRTLALGDEKTWLDRAEAGPLSDDEFFDITRATSSTVQAFHEEMVEQLPGEGFEIGDLVPRSTDYFENLFDAPAALPLGRAIEQYIAAERGRLSRVDAVVAAGPLAVSPAFDAAKLVKGLSQADKLRVAQGLVDAGDPFSLLAAFQIACANIKGRGFRELGDRMVEATFAAADSFDNKAKDFCVGVIVTSARMMGRGQDYSADARRRRLAAFAHAGHIARVLGQFEVQRDALLERVRAGFGAYFQLSATLDQRTGIGWEAGLLTPPAIGAYLLRRFVHVLNSAPEELRPEAWIELFAARVAAHQGDPTKMLLLGLPGPLDEASGGLPPRDRMKGKAFKDLLRELKERDPVAAINLAYVHPIVADLPARANVAELGDILIEKLEGVEPERLDDAVQIVLLLAWRWKMPAFARRVFDRFAKIAGNTTLALSWAVLAACACPERKEQSTMLGELALQATGWAPAQLDAGSLLAGLKAISNADGELRVAVGKAITAASLLL